jgi:lipopolysaccharide biosynthesis glycosyltransferase
MAFATVCTDGYVKYLKAFLRSIQAYNPLFNIPFYVISSTDKLSQDSMNELRKEYNNIVFKGINEANYEKHGKANCRYWSIEAFTIGGYDKVIYFGCDVICMGDIRELYDMDVETVAMTREQRRQATFNNNCMIINGKLCEDDTYIDLLRADYSDDTTVYGTDQKVYTLYFKDKIQELEQKWNVLVSESDLILKEDIKFLHYIYKPDHPQGKPQLHQWQIDKYEEYA